MGSSPSRTSGRVTAIVEIGGKKYRLTEPQKVGTIGRMEEFILSRRVVPDVFAIDACRKAPATMHTAIWAGAAIAASRGMATPEEWDAFNGSLWRTAFMFFESLHPRHKSGKDENVPHVPDVETALDIITEDEVDTAKLIAQVRHVGQDEALKNSDGPTTTVDPGQNQRMDDPNTPDGLQSTTDWPSDTDGPETK